jgi:hypothetical protein
VAEPAPKAKKAKKAKKEKLYDHNCDEHRDNGWVKKGTSTLAEDCDYGTSQPAPAAPAPAADPAPASPEKGRSASAPGHTKGDRPETAPGQENRPDGAPGQAKKSL